MRKLFDGNNVVNMDEYVGYNINVDDGFTYTQLVMLQIFSNNVTLPEQIYITPMMIGNTLKKSKKEDVEPPEEMTYFYKELGKLIHMMR